MNQPHHHHPGVSLGQLPIGMVTAHGSGAPLGIGIGIPIMTSGQLQQMVHSQQPRNNGHNNSHNHAHNPNMVSPDSSDDGHHGHRSHSPMTSTRLSPHSISSSNPLTWPHGSLLQPIAGMGYPVMGMGVMGPSHLGEPGVLYGINLISQGHGHPPHGGSAPVQPPTPELVHHAHPHNHNSVSVLANSGPCNGNVAAASPGIPPAPVSIPIMSPTGVSQPQNATTTPSKEIIHCKSCTLFPPNPSAPPPTTRDKPPGCRTVFVGGLPENATDETVREIFDRCGDITTIRMSKKNFCHIRFELESYVENAIYLSGYRVRIGSNSDAANIGRFHVDYAQARDDLFEWECRQRQLMRELRHRERLEQERLLPPSPPPVVHYSEHEAVNLAERIKVEESFMKAVQVLITWLDRGDCNKRNATAFYSMVQSTNSHIRRLLTEKGQYEDELKKAKALGRQRMQGLLSQFSQIEKVFLASCHKKVWDHFTKAQRKNIDTWKKQATDIKNSQLQEALNDRTDEEMDLSDSDNEHNDSDNCVSCPKKIRLEDDNKNLHQLKEENDSLRCQLEAFKNEVDLIKADLKTEMELKDSQLQALQQQLLATQPIPSGSSPTQSDSEISALRAPYFPDPLTPDANRNIEISQTRCDSTQQIQQNSPPCLENGNSGRGESENSTPILEREARLIAVISTFLHVHPFGASLDYIWSYAQKIVTNVTPNQIQSLMFKYPSLFRQELSGVGATLERKWTFGGFSN